MRSVRYLAAEIRRLAEEERRMAFIAGPRQVGKTTLARRLLEAAGCSGLYFNWDVEPHRRAILKDPVGFWRNAAGDRRDPLIALDEIHKYPRWKRFLKGLFDAVSKEARFLVTGSGRLDLYQKGGDSLFGRYGLYRLHPFTVGERIGSDPSRDPDEIFSTGVERRPPASAGEALEAIDRFTGFPEPLFAADEARLVRWRRARHAQVLREDLRDLTRIRDIGLIDALVELLPERVGSPLSLNALREDLGVAFGTVQGWIAALERLYYVFEIRPFAGKLVRTLRREGKVYLFDGGVIEAPGPRFENLVALHLRKACDWWTDMGRGVFDLHYVRDKEKREVDFLVTRNRKPYLLAETKLRKEGTSPDLLYFAERMNPKFAFQLARAADADSFSRASGGITHLAAARFLAVLP